jgi:hypothetical protein
MPKRRFKVLIETKEYGTLYLRSSLTGGDLMHLSDLQESDIDPREFTAQAVSRFVYLPDIDLEEIRSWDDSLLVNVATTWANQKKGTEWPLQDDLPPFDAFKHGYVAYSNSVYRDMRETIAQAYAPVFKGVAETFGKQFADLNRQALKSIQSGVNLLAESVLGSFRENFAHIVQSFKLEVQVGKFFENLPDLSELLQQHEKIAKAATALDEGGYRFMRYQWSLNEIARFVGIDQIDPRVRNAAITNRLLSLTRSDEFAVEMEGCFHDSSVLQPRWGIIEQALIAHRNRSYALSIPTLLAQAEGIFTDALILKDMVVRVNGKLYAKDRHGKPKLGKDGKPVQLRGLGQKVQNSKFRNDDILRDLVEFFADSLVSERNDILHGNHLAYDKAKLSVQLILSVYFLAAELTEFESES